jgi:methanogenic corrinoid protein MtbC1
LSTLLESIESSFVEVTSTDEVKNLTQKALAGGVSPAEIMRSMSNGLEKAGRKYEEGEFFLSDLIMIGMMAQEVSSLLKPRLSSSMNYSLGKVVIGTVKGDIHDLGKNLVAMMLSSAGFEVVDLGVDVAAKKFVDNLVREPRSIAAMSCLLTTAMGEMKSMMNELEQAGIRKRVKVLVGGRPITSEFANEIGADGYGEDAIQAVNAAKNAMNRQDE